MNLNLLLPLLIVFMIVMLFVNSRQRKKQQAQFEELQKSVRVGDVVVMTSGISGTIVDVDDERTVDLEIAPDVITTWLRQAIREKLNPETEGGAHDADDASGPSSFESIGSGSGSTPPADAIGGVPTHGSEPAPSRSGQDSSTHPGTDSAEPSDAPTATPTSEPSNEAASPRSS